jgi:iron complex outermembrane receptor protein
MVVIVQAITLTVGILFWPLSVRAAEPASARNFFELSFQEVLDLKVSLPSKKQEPLFSSPLSTSVVTRDEIISSGAASIPEALRLVPGVIVREQTPPDFLRRAACSIL